MSSENILLCCFFVDPLVECVKLVYKKKFLFLFYKLHHCILLALLESRTVNFMSARLWQAGSSVLL